MAQTNLTIRIDEDIKREAENLFNRIGLNMSAAINVFFRQAIREQANRLLEALSEGVITG